MSFSLDKLVGVHEQALYLGSRRSQILAANLANADTPNYKARDIDFRAALQQATAGQGGPLLVTNPEHIQPGQGASDGDVLYRQPQQPAIDGNTVEPQVEMAQFMENALHYEASLSFISNKFQGLLRAIRGD